MTARLQSTSQTIQSNMIGKLDCGTLNLKYVKFSEQLADCLTKGLGSNEVKMMGNKMGMIDIFSPS